VKVHEFLRVKRSFPHFNKDVWSAHWNRLGSKPLFRQDFYTLQAMNELKS
jgi:hypothetical protein